MATTTRAPRKSAKTEPVPAAQETPAAAPAAEGPTASDTAQSESTAVPADENPAVPDVAPPVAPDAAPLEPPAAPEIPEASATQQQLVSVSPTEAIPAAENLSDVILDDATKQPPADLDAVFKPELPYGSNVVCQIRLVERTFLGPHSNPIERLLVAQGATVAPYIAARIMERLRERAAQLAADASDDK